MASLQPSLGFNVDRTKENIVYREVSRAIRPTKEFCRPPESVVNSCRARMGRPIANFSDTSRQRAKVSKENVLKKRVLDFSNFPSAD
jgi:hypothetical protein